MSFLWNVFILYKWTVSENARRQHHYSLLQKYAHFSTMEQDQLKLENLLFWIAVIVKWNKYYFSAPRKMLSLTMIVEVNSNRNSCIRFLGLTECNKKFTQIMFSDTSLIISRAHTPTKDSCTFPKHIIYCILWNGYAYLLNSNGPIELLRRQRELPSRTCVVPP